MNPKTDAIVFRCPLADGAVLKPKADATGMTVSAYVARLVREDVGEVELTDAERKWVEEHRAAPRHAAEACALGGVTPSDEANAVLG